MKIKTLDLSNVMMNRTIRNNPIWATGLKPYDSGDSKGKGYAGKNKEVYLGEAAKEILAMNIIDGLNGPEIAAKLNLEDTRGFIVGNTMVAHRIASDQTGALNGVANAKELLDNLIDETENYAPFI